MRPVPPHPAARRPRRGMSAGLRPALRFVPALAAVAVASFAAAVALPVAAHAATMNLISVVPKTVVTAGTATVRVRITGLSVDSTASLVVGGMDFESSLVSQEVASVQVRSVLLLGAGSMTPALPPLTAFPPSCERGGLHPGSGTSAYRLSVPATKTADFVITVAVPEGFAGQVPAVHVESGPLVRVGQPAPAGAVNDVLNVPVPRTGRILEGVELAVERAKARGSYTATGRIWPARGGAIIRFLGMRAALGATDSARTLIAAQQLGTFAQAMAPVSDTFAAYGRTTTDGDGSFEATFAAPRGTVLIARTRGRGGVIDPGASCPQQLG